MAASDTVTPPSTPKKIQKKLTKNYSTCLLYNTEDSLTKLSGLVVAACNPTSEEGPSVIRYEPPEEKEVVIQQRADFTSISEKMSCNYCAVDFTTRDEQIKHYKSDWHRYNLRQRLKGHNSVSEERFEEISACVSSISGSESESEDSAQEGGEDSGKSKSHKKPALIPSHLRERYDSYSSNESETESSATYLEESSRRYPKLYFRNSDGELISVYRCVVYHKKNQPTTHNELVAMVTEIPQHLKWVVMMASGGHFAGVVFEQNKIIAHKTFHRYVVRAKRGTAQGSRDSQGNAPKSAGASLRRYNEAALKEEIQELITSWNDHIKNCDLIFLRAPSFNRKLFFSGKTPPLRKDDLRVRMIPFATRRPTHNEVRRVHEVLCSVECYGSEADTQNHIPLSPPVTFCPDTGHLEVIPDDKQTSPRHRRIRDKEKLGTSPLANAAPGKGDNAIDSTDKSVYGNEKLKPLPKGQQLQVIDALLQNETITSSGTSTASETELVETMETLSTADLKEYGGTKKPKRRKNKARKRRPSLRHQLEPETDTFAEEKYHLKNSLYTACKIGDCDTLCNLLAVFQTDQTSVQTPGHQSNSVDLGQTVENSTENERDSTDLLHSASQSVEDSSKSLNDLVTIKHSDESDVMSKNSAEILTVDQSGEQTEHLNLFEKDQNHTNQSSVVQKDGICGDSVGKEEKIGDCNSVKVDKAGDKSKLSLAVSKQSAPEDILSPVVTSSILSEPIGDQQITLLHVATKNGHKKLIRHLLQAGADPAKGDKYGQTPYLCTADKEIRNEYRRFMAKFPDKYDYEAAKIPCALTPEMEAERKQRDADRKKVQRKAKQERIKEKRAEDTIKQAEEKEKQRFLALSDREKRALAAEKRLVHQKENEGAKAPVLSRCYMCGKDMTGKVPFEYYDFKFCTPKCLKEHRAKSAMS